MRSPSVSSQVVSIPGVYPSFGSQARRQLRSTPRPELPSPLRGFVIGAFLSLPWSDHRGWGCARTICDLLDKPPPDRFRDELLKMLSKCRPNVHGQFSNLGFEGKSSAFDTALDALEKLRRWNCFTQEQLDLIADMRRRVSQART
jgi:hypothetical protein